MRKLFLLTLIILTAAAGAFAQGQTAQNSNEIPNMGRAPREPNGIGRLDLRVVDEDGNPIENVRADLQSKRSDGFTCDSWNWTNARGVAVLPPLHMGRLTLTLKAKGFATQKVEVLANNLNEPVRVTMLRK